MSIKEIVKLVKIPTSSEQLSNMLDGNVRIINYRQLKKYNNIDDVLNPFGYVIILYETKLNNGHWIGIIKNKNVIEHFDSYGYMPDNELKFVPKKFRDKYYPKKPYLTKLLYESGLPIRYNHYKLQSKNVSTCGRWVVARIIFKHLNEDEFAKLFYVKGIPRDFLVSAFTKLIL